MYTRVKYTKVYNRNGYPGIAVIHISHFYMKNILSFFLLTAATIGCHDERGVDNDVLLKNLDFSTAEYRDLETLGDVEILPVFSDTNVFVDQIRYGQVSKEHYIFITAQYKIHVFDPEFQFERSIFSFGKGPGETIMPIGLSKSESNSEFYIVDPGNRKILRMDVSGNVIEEMITDHWIKNANKFSNEENLFIGNVNGSKSPALGKSYDLLLLDEEGEIVRGYFEFEEDGTFGIGNGRNLHRISADYFGYYRMYDDKIYHVYADGPLEAYAFSLEMPLLPRNLVIDHALGKIGLDEFVYFLSYFEDESQLLLTYELDRKKYWSVYDKIDDHIYNYKFSYAKDCGNCNNINTIALTEEGAIAVVSGETLLRMMDGNKIGRSLPAGTDIESEYYLVKLGF